MTRTAPFGLFVVFEGGEGAGKTTQVALLAERLGAAGRDVVVTREPGGTAIGAALRELLLHHPGGVPERAEALLFAADRAAHAETIRDALADGAVVVCDRFEDSSVAYQGAGRALGESEVAWLSHWGTKSLHADLTVLLDVDPRVGLVRAGKVTEPDRIEREDMAFHDRVRRAFRARAGHHRDLDYGILRSIMDGGQHRLYLVLDATRPPEAAASAVVSAVDKVLASHVVTAR